MKHLVIQAVRPLAPLAFASLAWIGSSLGTPAADFDTPSLATIVAPCVATPMQTPPDEQNPWLCYDIVGWERPCTITEEWVLCRRAAQDSRIQCLQKAGVDVAAMAVCAARFLADETACDVAVIGHFWWW